MSDDDDFTEDISEPCPEGRGVTIDDFVAYLPYARLHLHALPGDVDRRRASMPRCRECRCSPRPASPSATRTARSSPSPPPRGSTAIGAVRADDLVPGLSHADQGSPGGRTAAGSSARR